LVVEAAEALAVSAEEARAAEEPAEAGKSKKILNLKFEILNL